MTILKLTLIIAIAAPVAGHAQAKHPGIALFQTGKHAEAARSLETATGSKEYKSDPEIWATLGLAYMALQKVKDAEKAFEKSTRLSPTNSSYRSNLAYAYLLTGKFKPAKTAAEQALELDPKNAGAYEVRGRINLWQNKLDLAESDADAFIRYDPANVRAYALKSDILLTKFGSQLKEGSSVPSNIDLMKRAVDSLSIGMRRGAKNPHIKDLEIELESLTAFYEYFSRQKPSNDPAGKAEPGITPVKVTYQPKAAYTDRARSVGISGATVRLALLLGADGKIHYILKLFGVGFGLDEQAILAAKQIKFEPKLKDGKPVPTVIVREYTFTLY